MPPPRTSCALAGSAVVLAGFLWLGAPQTSRAAPSTSNEIVGILHDMVDLAPQLRAQPRAFHGLEVALEQLLQILERHHGKHRHHHGGAFGKGMHHARGDKGNGARSGGGDTTAARSNPLCDQQQGLSTGLKNQAVCRTSCCPQVGNLTARNQAAQEASNKSETKANNTGQTTRNKNKTGKVGKTAGTNPNRQGKTDTNLAGNGSANQKKNTKVGCLVGQKASQINARNSQAKASNDNPFAGGLTLAKAQQQMQAQQQNQPGSWMRMPVAKTKGTGTQTAQNGQAKGANRAPAIAPKGQGNQVAKTGQAKNGNQNNQAKGAHASAARKGALGRQVKYAQAKGGQGQRGQTHFIAAHAQKSLGQVGAKTGRAAAQAKGRKK